MKTKLIKLSMAIIGLFILPVFGMSTSTLAAQTNGGNGGGTTDVCSSNAAQAVKDAAGCNGGGDDLGNVVVNIVEAIIGICGLVAVIFVVIGGIQYMTSTGDSAKTKQAKNTILYALIGLAICALSFAIDNWVIQKPLGQGSGDQNSSVQNGGGSGDGSGGGNDGGNGGRSGGGNDGGNGEKAI